jgi:hypothetical protein
MILSDILSSAVESFNRFMLSKSLWVERLFEMRFGKIDMQETTPTNPFLEVHPEDKIGAWNNHTSGGGVVPAAQAKSEEQKIRLEHMWVFWHKYPTSVYMCETHFSPTRSDE